MTISYGKQIMIKEIFETEGGGHDGWSFGSDIFGKYFLFRYPGYDENKYYSNINIITDGRERFNDDIIFSKIRYDASDTKARKTILYYYGKYYIIDGAVLLLSVSHSRGSDRDILARFDKTVWNNDTGFSENIELRCKTEAGFKKIFNKLDKKEINI